MQKIEIVVNKTKSGINYVFNEIKYTDRKKLASAIIEICDVTPSTAQAAIQTAIDSKKESELEDDRVEHTQLTEADIELFSHWIYIYCDDKTGTAKLCIRKKMSSQTFKTVNLSHDSNFEVIKGHLNTSFVELDSEFETQLDALGYEVSEHAKKIKKINLFSLLMFMYDKMLQSKVPTLGKYLNKETNKFEAHSFIKYLPIVWPYISTHDTFKSDIRPIVMSNNKDTYATRHHIYDSEFKQVSLNFFTQFEDMLPSENHDVWVHTFRAMYAASFNEKYIGRQAMYLYDSVGKSGKSTFINAWTEIMGEDIVAVVPDKVNGDTFGMSAFEDKSMFFISDLFNPHIARTSLFHNLTGSDIQSIRHMNQSAYAGKLTIKMGVMAGNKQLEFDTTAKHEMSRLIIFPLSNPDRAENKVLNSEDVIASYKNEHQTYLKLCQQSYNKLSPNNAGILVDTVISEYMSDTGADEETITIQEYIRKHIRFVKDYKTPAYVLSKSFAAFTKGDGSSNFIMSNFKKYLKNQHNVVISKTKIFDNSDIRTNAYIGIEIINCSTAEHLLSKESITNKKPQSLNNNTQLQSKFKPKQQDIIENTYEGTMIDGLYDVEDDAEEVQFSQFRDSDEESYNFGGKK